MPKKKAEEKKFEDCIDVIDQCKDWFVAKNPQAYMILLD